MPQRPVQPANAILVSGNPIYEEYEVETAANMYPGKLVKAGSDERYVVVCAADGTTGLGVLDVMPDQNLQTMYTDSTTYSQYDQVRIIRGDCVVKMRADHAATIAIGAKVYAGPDGNVDEGVTTDALVGIAEEDAAPSATDVWINVKLTAL